MAASETVQAPSFNSLSIDRPEPVPIRTINVFIRNIGGDRHGNRLGHFVAWRDGVVIADSGRRRRQLQGTHDAAARNWLASLGIVTDERISRTNWSAENLRGRVTDVRLDLIETV